MYPQRHNHKQNRFSGFSKFSVVSIYGSRSKKEMIIIVILHNLSTPNTIFRTKNIFRSHFSAKKTYHFQIQGDISSISKKHS